MEFQVDITPEEFHNSIKSEVAVHSDIKPFTEALTQKLAEKKFTLEPASNNWWQALKTKQKANTEFVQVYIIDENVIYNNFLLVSVCFLIMKIWESVNDK